MKNKIVFFPGSVPMSWKNPDCNEIFQTAFNKLKYEVDSYPPNNLNSNHQQLLNICNDFYQKELVVFSNKSAKSINLNPNDRLLVGSSGGHNAVKLTNILQQKRVAIISFEGYGLDNLKKRNNFTLVHSEKGRARFINNSTPKKITLKYHSHSTYLLPLSEKSWVNESQYQNYEKKPNQSFYFDSYFGTIYKQSKEISILINPLLFAATNQLSRLPKPPVNFLSLPQVNLVIVTSTAKPSAIFHKQPQENPETRLLDDGNVTQAHPKKTCCVIL